MTKTIPSAKVVADSVSSAGDRLTTMEVTFHRYVLAEMNTHRVFTRNTASSRAIPMKKVRERVRLDPANPLHWGANRPGMQATDELTGWRLFAAKRLWDVARWTMILIHWLLERIGLHKQVANRLLETFSWTTAVITSTEWDNFFVQRDSALAQPEIRPPAIAMKAALERSVPRRLGFGEWHLPYVSDDERKETPIEITKKMSVARCSRASTLGQNKIREAESELTSFERLATAEPMHASPMEHVATPLFPTEMPKGNFRGWRQLRHLIEDARRAK